MHSVLFLPMLQRVVRGFPVIFSPHVSQCVAAKLQWMDRRQNLTWSDWEMKGSTLHSDMEVSKQRLH